MKGRLKYIFIICSMKNRKAEIVDGNNRARQNQNNGKVKNDSEINKENNLPDVIPVCSNTFPPKKQN